MNTVFGSFALFVGLALILLGGRMLFKAEAEAQVEQIIRLRSLAARCLHLREVLPPAGVTFWDWQQADLDLIRDLREEVHR